MKRIASIALAVLITGTLAVGGFVAVESLLDYSPPVEAAPTYMGDYWGHNVTCSKAPTTVAARRGSKLQATCANATFSWVRYDPEDRDRCLKTLYRGNAALYSWGMTFTVESTTDSSFRCLRPV